ncbi:unnamed protein product [Protopolystoma xenopodis]|uniref:Uncharacterized protein n=1 Tax=Protopolystoma xenopodis TaxID=117903 RepID=A0A3S5CHE9_9PLAT|nr:unnamed protein product [Protopolystoma xenopodis]
MTPDKLKAAKFMLNGLRKTGIIRLSRSELASALYLFQKKDRNEWRPCGDFKRLNAVTVPGRCPLQRVTDVVLARKGRSLEEHLKTPKMTSPYLTMSNAISNALNQPSSK